MRSPRSRISAVAISAIALLATATITVAMAGPAAHATAGLLAGQEAVTTAKLPQSVAPFATASAAVGAVPVATKLTIQFWMTPQSAAAARYAAAVSTPGNPHFRHFLSPSGYTARFGPSQAAVASLKSWLKAKGFTGIGADLGGDYVQATAPVSTIQAALQVRLNYYHAKNLAGAGRYPLRANDRPVSLPAPIARQVLGVTGLNNAAPTMTYVSEGVPARDGATRAASSAYPCSQWYLQHYATGLAKMYGVTEFPTIICGYTPQQLRRAYNLSTSDVGTGITVALIETGLTTDMFQTLADYAKAHDFQAPSAARYAELSLGQGSQCGDPFNVEEQLDVEASYVMAPAASQLVVGGDSCDNGFSGVQALFDADTAVLNGIGDHPLAQIASNSWIAGNESISANMLQIAHAFLIRAAAEGVSMLYSTGDTSGLAAPASDPYATAVGGTTLAIGHDHPRLFETGWSTGSFAEQGGQWSAQGENGASGGGASMVWKQPDYQKGVVPGSLAAATGDRGNLVRAIPDISADADSFTGMSVGMLSLDDQGSVTGYFEEAVGGTSLATPLVAGIVADAEQGQGAFGFLNPVLYELAGTRAFNDARPLSAKTNPAYRGVICDEATCGALLLTMFDDECWTMTSYTGQVTVPGYDTMTGIGTPEGQPFISDLRSPWAAAAQ